MKVKKKPETFTLNVPGIPRKIQAKIKTASALTGINLGDWIKRAIQEKAEEQILKGRMVIVDDSDVKEKIRLAKNRWRSMIDRCENPKHPKYKNYGGRGITVCNKWHDFEKFYKNTGDRPEGMSLDRIDNDGNYEPDNWRWATAKEQHENSRSICL